VDKARARVLLDQERRRLDLLGRAVARDHDDAVAGSRPEDQVDGAGRRVAEETSEAWASGCVTGGALWSGRRLVWRRAPSVPRS
jgi:hypothetical protein